MQGARNVAPSDVRSYTEARRELPFEPLPWLEAGGDSAADPSPHSHSCAICGTGYDCDGPEDNGSCAPVCPPCYWAALGAQLEAFHEAARELSRKRNEIERRVGIEACRRSEATRRRKASTDAGLVVAMDTTRAHR